MSTRNIYDNWERLVVAAVKKQQLWELFHQQSRSPSLRSEASDYTPSSSFRSSIHDDVDFLIPGNSSRLHEALAKLHPKLVYVSDFNPSFDVENVFLATSELLWRGNFGSVYKVVMENGVTIVVKRLKPGMTSEVEFKRAMEITGNVKHENVVPLRAYYSSAHESIMLYDHYAKGSVFLLLHGKTGRNSALVDWETRLKIALGAARGIAEIHAQDGGKFVHGNIKASNVFINSERFGCISDLGLANIIATNLLPSALCYAPEMKKAESVSQASDVYSFGVLLLELLTRKCPVHIPGGPPAADLVKLVTSVKSKEWAVKVFDADLLRNPQIKDHMIYMMQIGIRCVAKSPKKRPKMFEVVKMLEEINTISLQIPASLENKLVFFQDNNLLNLEDLLKASAEVLGKGTFGTCYKATLDIGTVVVVKRLKDVRVSSLEFQTQMEIIGRMRHENVASLNAYFYSQDEKLMLYDCNNEGSLSNLLSGSTSTGYKRESLDWNARLKIATGAARGIAYIHKQDGGSFVHGNIKSSNIFLNEQLYGLVSDAGIVNLIDPRASITKGPRLWAPELVNTGRVSQASDVYGFGVVILELVTGKPSQFTTNDGKSVSLVEWVLSVVRREWTNEVFDINLVRDETDEEAMVLLLQVGVTCAVSIPESRPKMAEVVNMLDKISGVYVYQEDQHSVESGLEHMLEDLLHSLVP